ncbi:MAG TPA: Trp biosynthesis-associated membrane protein [Candidatus Nanopelagicales bacterium]|jgi:uncharacterized membrane protein (TIGR02234 family)
MSDPRPDAGPGLLRALGALAVGSVLAYVAFGQPWVTLTIREAGLPAAVQTVTGRDLAPAPGTLPVLLLALVLVIWATGGWLRRAVGVLVAVVSAVVLVAAIRGAPGLLPPDLQTRYGLTGVATYDTTFWWVLAAAGSLAALAAGVLTTVHRGRWSGMAGRYERRSGTAEPSQRKARPKERSAWEQLDAGTDPTEPAVPEDSDAGTMTPSAAPDPAPSIEATGTDAATTEEDLR